MSGKTKNIIKIMFIIVVLALPIIPVEVVPQVTLKVVDAQGNPMPNLTVMQWWQHWSFESESHREETISNADGYVTFPERKLWMSSFRYGFGKIGDVIGMINIHAGSGPHAGFNVEGYKSESKWCYPCRKEQERRDEIVVLERVQ